MSHKIVTGQFSDKYKNLQHNYVTNTDGDFYLGIMLKKQIVNANRHFDKFGSQHLTYIYF